jgi:molybdopterin-guanine dinucleotide biosynthesis protein A
MTLAAVLLAGGESRRMGRDKSTLTVDGIPLWRRQLDLLRRLAPAELLVSARYEPHWLPADARFVADAAPGHSPLGGLAAALEGTRCSHLLALAIDQPAMTASHLAALWRAAAPRCGVLPWLDGRAEPLPAIYPVEAAPGAATLLAGPDLSLRTFADALADAGSMKRHIIGSPDAKLYANCNTPADWRRHVTHAEIHD